LPAGALVGPLLGGVLIDLWGFRELLISLSLLLVLWGLVAASILVERSSRRTSEAGRDGGGVLQTFRELLMEPRLRLFLLAGLCANIASYGLMTVFAPYVQRLLPSSDHVATWVGFFEATTSGGALLGAAWWGRRNDRLPVEWNFMLAALCCGLFVMLQGVPKALGWLLVLRFLQGFAFSALIQSVFLTVSRASHDGNRGVRIASASSVLVIGQIAGGLASAMLSSVIDTPLVFVTLGSVLLLASLLAALSRFRPLATMPLPSQSPQQ
jgi:predicted MFS family arabinose efflux permease